MLDITLTEQQARAVARAARLALNEDTNVKKMGPGDTAAAYVGIKVLEEAIEARYGEIAHD
jgi:hypothetical protein